MELMNRSDVPESENLIADLQNIIETAQNQAYSAVNALLVQRNWLIGERIAREELSNAYRAEYGTAMISCFLRN